MPMESRSQAVSGAADTSSDPDAKEGVSNPPLMVDSGSSFADEESLLTIPDDHSIRDIYCRMGKDGRTYQGYMPSEYVLPNDTREQDRLDYSHEIYRLLLDGKFAEAPIREPEYALDIATGTGLWAMQFAEDNPNCHVMGTDLSVIQPPSWMPNCHFVQENSELHEWHFPNKFDYIHLRGTIACFNDVRTVMQRCFDNLHSGGWIEFQDACFDIQGLPDESAFRHSAIQRWSKLVQSGAVALGRHMTKARLYKQQLSDLGFVDVEEKVINVPGGPWSEAKQERVIGALTGNVFYTDVVDSFRNFVVAAGELPLTEVEELMTRVKDEIRDARIKWLIPMYVVYGRKPYKGES